MFQGLGASEIILILVIALVVFGPRKLPEIGKAFGKTLNEFRRASFTSFNDIEAEIKDATEVTKPLPKEIEKTSAEATVVEKEGK